MKYDWYGNIRELNNFLDRLHIFYPITEPTDVEIQYLIDEGQLGNTEKNGNGPRASRKSEQTQIQAELEKQRYQISKTAKALGISRSTLYRKMKQYQIE